MIITGADKLHQNRIKSYHIKSSPTSTHLTLNPQRLHRQAHLAGLDLAESTAGESFTTWRNSLRSLIWVACFLVYHCSCGNSLRGRHCCMENICLCEAASTMAFITFSHLCTHFLYSRCAWKQQQSSAELHRSTETEVNTSFTLKVLGAGKGILGGLKSLILICCIICVYWVKTSPASHGSCYSWNNCWNNIYNNKLVISRNLGTLMKSWWLESCWTCDSQNSKIPIFHKTCETQSRFQRELYIHIENDWFLMLLDLLGHSMENKHYKKYANV